MAPQSMDIPKPKLIAKLKRFIDDAKGTSLDELCKMGDYKHQPGLRYPQTKGEYLADSISTLLSTQSWIGGKSEPLLDDMLQVATQLDKNVDQPEAWHELFELAQELES